MTTRLKAILGIGTVGILAILGGLWFLGVFNSEPPPASVTDASEILAEEAGSADDGAEQVEVADAAPLLTDLSGTWTLEASEATFVGYRVTEVLSTIGEFVAVGRTPLVEGTLVAEGLTVTSVSIDADLTGLASDSAARDNQVKKQGLETGTFPQGLFELTGPITVDAIPASGALFTTTATGDLTLHGTTNSVTVNIEGSVDGERLIIVGRTDVLMSDFGIDAPKAPIVASIEDEAEMEFSLIFARN